MESGWRVNEKYGRAAARGRERNTLRRQPAAGLTDGGKTGYDPAMIETASFLFGLGFSVLVYFRSIRPAGLPWPKQAWYAVITFIGITGMLFLSGVLIAHTLRKLRLL